MNDQLFLKFPSYQTYEKENFYVSESNQKAFNFVETWPKWIRKIVNIYGPSGSGKTHLSSILKNKTTFYETNAKDLSEESFLKYKTKELLILENLNENIPEKILFSLWNTAIQDNKYVLITSKKPINFYKFNLKDLKSRINSTLSIGIELPSDDLISVIIAKNFSDKQIKIEKKHIEFIIKRIDRSYEKITQFISTLDKYSLKKGSPFGLKLIKEVLKMI